jgi:Polyketide cyclase / dehydrase and lipid transport
MPQNVASASAVVHAAPQVAYGILIDYRELHPRILPRPPFGELVVETGGLGAGTVFTVEAREGTRIRKLRMEATEPQPGRLLMETDLNPQSDLVTTFAVEPMDGGRHSRVTITTRWTRDGLRGWIERLLVIPLMQAIFRKEIANLDQLARERSSSTAAAGA